MDLHNVREDLAEKADKAVTEDGSVQIIRNECGNTMTTESEFCKSTFWSELNIGLQKDSLGVSKSTTLKVISSIKTSKS